MTGMLAIWLRGANPGFWSHLRYPDEIPIFLAVKGSFRVASEEIKKKRVSFYPGENQLEKKASWSLASSFK